MVNKLSESGHAEDLIRSYIQFGCAEVHAKTLYEKATSELDNGLVDVSDEEVLQKQLEKCQAYKDDINEYSDMRRDVMRKLLDMFPNGDKDLWCQAKHLGIGAMQLWESYVGSDDDVELLQMAYRANQLFIKAMTRFLGIEWTDCASCFSDRMRGKDDGEL